MNDKKIIELYWQRNESAVSESQKAYGAYCFTIADRILGSREDSEECVSDTWLHAWNAIPPERPNILSAFFGRIVRNLAIDSYAKQHAAKRGGGETALILDELAECVGSEETAESAFDCAELEKSVNRFLQSLPQRERNIFLARYWFAESQKEIALRFGAKEANIKASLFRSREKLKTQLEKEGLI